MTTLIYGPSYSMVQSTAAERADELAGHTPNSVRWLEQNSHIASSIEDRWAGSRESGAERRSPLRLTVGTLDRMAGESLDRTSGPRDLLGALTRRQIVDTSLRHLDDEGVLEDAHRYRDTVMDLLASLEKGGHWSPDKVEALVEESDVPERSGDFLVEAARRYHQVLDAVTTDTEYTGVDAYRQVSQVDLDGCFPETDVVVLSGYHDLSLIERQFIEDLAEAFELVVTLPWVDTPGDNPGVNNAAREAMDFYTELATDVEHISADVKNPLPPVAGQLYTPTAPGKSTDENGNETLDADDLPDDRLRWVEAPTPDREVRQVARSIKHRIATESGFSQDNTLVVVPGLISYREHVEDIFTAHGLTPVTFVNKLLYQTNTGRAMLDLVALCQDETADANTVASLATNPAINVGLDGANVTELAQSLPTANLELLREKLGRDEKAALERLLDAAETVRDATGSEFIATLRDLFEEMGLDEEMTPYADATGFDASMERRAIRRVGRALDAVRRVAARTDSGEVLERVADELDQIRIPPPTQATDGVLEVAGPREAFGQSYDHLYLIGMTNRDFPSDPDRPVFFEELWDGLKSVAPTDHRAVARYQFGTMLASAESVYITTPEASINGDPLIESPVLDELRGVTGIGPTPDAIGNGYREDAQRAVGHSTTRSAGAAVKHLVDAGIFDKEVATRAQNGVECASNRAGPERTIHDGMLDSATVNALYPSEAREPYSPSQLTDFAKCGFRFLMERVLDIEDPLEYNLEPNPLDIGSVVHDTLEYFYCDLQTGPGDHVDLTAHDRSVIEERLLAAGEQAIEDASLPYEGAFYQRWLESLFAGLCTPESNPHYGGRDGIHEIEQGLFAKFLEEELDRDPDAGPGWFEVQLDLTDGDDGAIDLTLPDGRTVPVGGRIDRVAVDRTDDPPTGLVHDYKTGGGNLREAADGVTFQLPLYALAAGRELETDGVQTPFDAAFYTLNHDSLGDGWDLSYYLYREGDAEDSNAHYRRLVEEETPRRIGDIVDSIEHGAFQPTALDEGTAGCRHCEFSDVCDVRYHMRRNVVMAIDGDDRPSYAPDYAREESFLAANGGGNE